MIAEQHENTLKIMYIYPKIQRNHAVQTAVQVVDVSLRSVEIGPGPAPNARPTDARKYLESPDLEFHLLAGP